MPSACPSPYPILTCTPVPDGEINKLIQSPTVEHQRKFNLRNSSRLRYFDGMDNLSPYIAFELPITIGTFGYAGFWGPSDINDAGQPDQYIVWNLGNEQGFTTFGFNILFGADYYFSDAIYLGFEAEIGFGRTTFGNHTITTDNLTAFNMYFNNAFSTEAAGAEIAGEFVDNALQYWMVRSTTNTGPMVRALLTSTTLGLTTSATPPLETYSKAFYVLVFCLTDT